MSNPAYPQIPARLQKIDQLTTLDHAHIEDDECYFLWERTSGARYDAYPTNQLISNFQIPMSCRSENVNRWRWKRHAISYAVRALSEVIPPTWFAECVFIPVPPSKSRGDAAHDRRLVWTLQELKQMAAGPRPLDFREIVFQKENTAAKEKGISPEERANNYGINEPLCRPVPGAIVVFDDLLAGGSHFKAMKMALAGPFPNVPIRGLFLARAIRCEGTA